MKCNLHYYEGANECPSCMALGLAAKNTKPDDRQVGGDHYKKHAITPWMIIEEYKLNFFEGSALKYLLRHRDKHGIEDLKKLQHYVEKLIEVEEKNVTKTSR